MKYTGFINMSFAYGNVTVEESKWTEVGLLVDCILIGVKKIIATTAVSENSTVIMGTCLTCFLGTFNFGTGFQFKK